MFKFFSKVFKKKVPEVESEIEEPIIGVKDEAAASEEINPPALIAKVSGDGIKMRHNVNELSFNTNALIIDSILMDMINNVGIKSYDLDDKKYI